MVKKKVTITKREGHDVFLWWRRIAAAYDAGERMWKCVDMDGLHDSIYCVHVEGEETDCGWVRIVREVDDE